MIRINLLPFRVEKKKEDVKRQILIYLLSLSLLISFSVFIDRRLDQEIIRLEKIRENKKRELLRYEKINRRIRRIKRKIKEYRRKIELIKRIAAYRLEPVKVIDEMVMAIPAGDLWLHSLKLSQGRLFLEGSAKDNDTVASFMERLKKMDHIEDVKLEVTRLAIINGFKVCNFRLSCKVFTGKDERKDYKKGRRNKEKS